MSSASPTLPNSSAESSWAERYERLRACGIELGSRLLDGAEGLVLLLRQGMVSWMLGLSAGTRTVPACRPPHEPGLPACDDRAEVTRMLASMVGAALEEARA